MGCLIDHMFGGWPFLDDTFIGAKLLTAVCCSRNAIDCDRLVSKDLDIKYYLLPDIANKLRNSQESPVSIDSVHASKPQKRLIRAAENRILSQQLEWKQYFNIPLKYRILNNTNIISCSCYAIPQTIYLGKKSFRSSLDLEEQILHELCHNWTYFIEEIQPLSIKGETTSFTLPSGTGNKNASEVLGAAYVAATLVKWYRNISYDIEVVKKRIDDLIDYLQGCLLLIDSINSYSPTGEELCNRLKTFYDNQIKNNHNEEN